MHASGASAAICSAVSYAAVAAANLNGVRGDVIRRSGDQAIR